MKRETVHKVRAAIYCRMAQDNDKHTALEIQKKDLRAFVKKSGKKITAEISEVASGSTLDRPGIEQLRNLVENRQIDEIIAVDQARIYRSNNMSEYASFLSELNKNGVKLTFKNQLEDIEPLQSVIGHIISEGF